MAEAVPLTGSPPPKRRALGMNRTVQFASLAPPAVALPSMSPHYLDARGRDDSLDQAVVEQIQTSVRAAADPRTPTERVHADQVSAGIRRSRPKLDEIACILYMLHSYDRLPAEETSMWSPFFCSSCGDPMLLSTTFFNCPLAANGGGCFAVNDKPQRRAALEVVRQSAAGAWEQAPFNIVCFKCAKSHGPLSAAAIYAPQGSRLLPDRPALGVDTGVWQRDLRELRETAAPALPPVFAPPPRSKTPKRASEPKHDTPAVSNDEDDSSEEVEAAATTILEPNPDHAGGWRGDVADAIAKAVQSKILPTNNRSPLARFVTAVLHTRYGVAGGAATDADRARFLLLLKKYPKQNSSIGAFRDDVAEWVRSGDGFLREKHSIGEAEVQSLLENQRRVKHETDRKQQEKRTKDRQRRHELAQRKKQAGAVLEIADALIDEQARRIGEQEARRQAELAAAAPKTA